MKYTHTQPVPMPVLFGGGIVGWLRAQAHKNHLARTLAPGALALTAEGMRSLAVEVGEEEVHITYGAGLFQKTFPLSDVESCQQKRLLPIHGWGIPWIGNGWLYNIYGLDAVELKFKNGSVAVIGTDEPTELEQAIGNQLRSRRFVD